MKMRTLGRTGLKVSELSLGAAFCTSGKDGFKGAKPLVKRALELGMNLADTSADYGDSEPALGAALHALGDAGKKCIVSTKLGPRGPGFNPKDKAGLRRIVEQSLENLHRDVIDIMMIHEPDRPGQFDWYDDGRSFHGPVVDLFAELKEEGLIKFTGLGGTTVYELARLMATGDYDVVLTAFNTSPLWREAQVTVLPEAKKQNMGVFLASPTQQGWLTARHDDELDDCMWISPPRRKQLREFYKFADEIDIELPVLCLRWALGVPDVSCVLTGPKNVQELEQNIQAVEEGPLPADAMKRIDKIAAMVPFRPYEEPFSNQWGNKRYWGPGPA